MPFVEGESLRERLKRAKQLSVEAALRITRPEDILLEGEVAGALGGEPRQQRRQWEGAKSAERSVRDG